jgi:hypothetical protein
VGLFVCDLQIHPNLTHNIYEDILKQKNSNNRRKDFLMRVYIIIGALFIVVLISFVVVMVKMLKENKTLKELGFIATLRALDEKSIVAFTHKPIDELSIAEPADTGQPEPEPEEEELEPPSFIEPELLIGSTHRTTDWYEDSFPPDSEY